MTDTERQSAWNALNENVLYIHEKVDTIEKTQTDFRISTEHRLTSVEIKSGLWGAISGLLGSVGIHWFKGTH